MSTETHPKPALERNWLLRPKKVARAAAWLTGLGALVGAAGGFASTYQVFSQAEVAAAPIQTDGGQARLDIEVPNVVDFLLDQFGRSTLLAAGVGFAVTATVGYAAYRSHLKDDARENPREQQIDEWETVLPRLGNFIAWREDRFSMADITSRLPRQHDEEPTQALQRPQPSNLAPAA